MPVHDAALLLLGHGSTLNADSSAPTYQHAEELRQRGLFQEVHVGFWKEEPNFRQALRQTRQRHVYVVPNFISSGYFTEQVIPRELGLTGPVTVLGDQTVFLCAPVGLHASMTEALLRRAGEVVAASPEPIADPAKTACLFICGHGTSLNDNSTKIIHEQAAIIRKRGLYADCQAVLMEQSPFVRDWRTLTACPDVIVVPFFIADGLHSFEDIPVLLGLTHNMKEKGFTNPHHEPGRRLWYSTAIGTEAFLADVIAAQVEQFQAEHPEAAGATTRQSPPLDDFLVSFFPNTPPPWRIGEIAILPDFTLLHHGDVNRPLTELHPITRFEDLREWIRLDQGDHFRPLRAAPNLRKGWLYRASNRQDVQLALDYFYPAELANAVLWQEKQLSPISWQETAHRQTGRFRIVRELDEPALHDLVATTCDQGCLKRRLWTPTAQDVTPAQGEIPLLCPEACNFLVGKAREKLKGPGED